MLAARMNYMAQDNPAIQYAAKEVCRKMARPKIKDFSELKKLARFILGVKVVKWDFPWQSEIEAMDMKVYADSDWAGCLDTRRSTSGGVLMLGRHPLRTWSSTQATVATSSAEAELYAMAEGASRGLGFQSTLQEITDDVSLRVLRVWTDSAAAKAFASTRGLGRMRHVQVKDLWIQSLVKTGRISLGKVRGDLNVADALTKYHDGARCKAILALSGLRVVPAESGVARAEGGC